MLQCYLQLFIGSKLFCEEVEGHQTDVEYLPFRSSRPGVFCKKGVLRKFAKITGKHLCQSLFFNKVAGLRLATSLKKRLWHRCFPVNFAKFLRTSFFIEHLWWLLLFFRKTKVSKMLGFIKYFQVKLVILLVKDKFP